MIERAEPPTGVPERHQDGPEHQVFWCPLCRSYICHAWARRAQRNYGFDWPTAQRLAFVRWLSTVGRLGDW